MKRLLTGFLAAIALCLLNLVSYAQGCGDSGFCTMGGMRPDQIFSRKLKLKIYALEVTQHLGHTRQGDYIHSTFLDVTLGLTHRTTFHLRLPSYSIVEGNMPTTRGFGDTFISVTQNLVANHDYQINATLGARIYNRWANEKKSSEGLSMPLLQQATYGSDDVILGLSFATPRALLAVGYQRALNRIQNQFRPEEWEGTSYEDIARRYTTSAGLERGDDLMVRLERNFRYSRWSFYVASLNLIRVTKDKTLNSEGKRISIDNTQGLASNIILGTRYRFDVHNSLKLLWSYNILRREVNPDGLDRDHVAQLSYEYRF